MESKDRYELYWPAPDPDKHLKGLSLTFTGDNGVIAETGYVEVNGKLPRLDFSLGGQVRRVYVEYYYAEG